MNRIVKILFVSIFMWTMGVTAQVPEYPAQEVPEIGIYEHLDEYLPDDIYLYDKDSNRVNVKDLVDKPTVFSFVFYTCPGLCPALLSGLSEIIERSDLELGKDYQVITISFDQNDRPSEGQIKKANYVASIKKPIDVSSWLWLTGDSVNISRITETLGFKFKRAERGFLHAAAIMVVSPSGKITRYLNGTYYLPFDFKMAVVESQSEISSPTINKVLQYCFSYDPKGKKYVLNVTKISGSVILGGAFILLFVLVVRRKPISNQEKENK